jgi:hypothetical protein
MPGTAASINAVACAAEDAIVTAGLAGAVRVCPVSGGVELDHTAGALGADNTAVLIDEMGWAGFVFRVAWDEGLTRVLAFDVVDESLYGRLTATRGEVAGRPCPARAKPGAAGSASPPSRAGGMGPNVRRIDPSGGY